MLVSVLRAFIFSIWCVCANAASAQQQPALPADAPLMGSEAAPAVPQSPSGLTSDNQITLASTRVLVIGDALAGGLGAGMARMVDTQPGLEIINRYNESSGLARTEVYDWAGALAKIVASKPVDAVVVLVGVNDRQEIRNGNVRLVFRAPDWVKAYTNNVDRLISAVQSSQAKLYWISIPPMENIGFDADMRYLSDIHRQQVTAKGGHYIDVRPFFVAADGSYVDRGPDETGVERKLRSRDGVTFFKQGNNRFGQLVLGAMKTMTTQTPVTPAVVEAPVVVEAQDPAAVVVREAPSFGQDGLEGESVVFRADSLKAPTTAAAPEKISVAQRNAAPNATASSGVAFVAQPGSAAEKLFVDGLVVNAPAGRFDDFSAPAVTP